MNLCIDKGNTRTKAAIFDGDTLKKVHFIDEKEDFSEWENLFSQYDIAKTIISSVKEINPCFIAFLQSKTAHFIELSHETPLPITNRYQTPETLGKDRLAAIVGVAALQPERDVLVIDAGTAITYDFVNSKGEYLGGNIAPGRTMRFRALHEFTDKLPQVEPEKSDELLGTNTETAIRAGVQRGIVYEMEGYIRSLKKKYPELLIFLTGGDGFFFAEMLKSSIFAEENLVLIGLNRILNQS